MTNENKKTLRDYGIDEELINKLDEAFSSTRIYKCVKDYQGTDFKVDQAMSEMDWLVWVIEDRYTSEDTNANEMAKFLFDNVQGKLIEWIENFYELKIVEEKN